VATKPATDTSTQPARSGEPSARRPVRLLRLGRFDQPTYLTAPRGDSRRFVVERPGTIRVLKGRRVLATPFLDIRSRVTTGGESGLLSMAFARDYRTSRRFWVYYTDQQGFIQIDQFRASASNPNRADPNSRRSVLRVPHHRFNHKGGQLQVGPDGMLYAGFGDGGAGGDPDENAQNLGRMLGKIIRIDPRPNGGYSIPPDNPFRNRSGALPEIYAYGVRNPWRFSFDRRTERSRSATWARTRSRRSTSSRRALAAASRAGATTSAGTRSRAEAGTSPGRPPGRSRRCSSGRTRRATARSRVDT
jgi:glucose/arabinose dehydrogenase